MTSFVRAASPSNAASPHDAAFASAAPHADVRQRRGERVARAAVRFVSRAVDAAMFVALFLMMIVGLYALWDANAVYNTASSSKWEAYIPTEQDHATYDELAAANPDVLGWLDVYGTRIDYPLVQADNVKYLTHDAKGAYSLTGALFLDEENADDFSDFSTIVYGHHLDGDAMFGEIGNFADARYFQEREYGTLFVGRGEHASTLYGLHFVAFLSADAYDGAVYRTKVVGVQQQQEYFDLLMQRATNVREVPFDAASGDRLVLLSTCSSEATNARSILVGKIEDAVHDDAFAEVEGINFGAGVDVPEGWFNFPWVGWAALAALVASLLALVLRWLGKRREARCERRSRVQQAARFKGRKGLEA